MPKLKTAFYAYPGQPLAIAEIIEATARDLTKSRHTKIRTWRQLSVPGKLIIKQVLDAINSAEIFACDLTFPNPNVLFELGYAIGRRKRVWVSLDTTMAGARESFAHLQATLCPVVGYASYTNSAELGREFRSSRPSIDISDHLLGEGFSPKAKKPPYPSLLYLKQPIDTQGSVALTELLANSTFAKGLITDSDKDNPSPTLNWYAEKIRDADAVIVHLLSEQHSDHQFHNLKCAFVAGLSRGLDRPVLMLAQSPYAPPLDYLDLLSVHDTAEQCRNKTTYWLSSLLDRLPNRRAGVVAYEDTVEPTLTLRNLSVGEYVAEYEHNNLDEYFVDTSWYYDALRSDHAIFVGRRGTGKTATMYAIEKNMSSSSDNYVCTIQPVGYEVDGIVRLLSQHIDRSERGYLIESLWKFLIYTELAISVVSTHEERTIISQDLLSHELDLVELAQRYSEIIMQPLSVRIQRVIDSLADLGSQVDSTAQRARISEGLHSGIMKDLRLRLGKALNGKKKVAILIDRLDDPWRPHHGITYLAELLVGLLRVTTDISEDLRHGDSRRLPVNAAMIIFLRSDIFYQVQRIAPEQDKLPVQFIAWSDVDVLMNLVDIRLRRSLGWSFTSQDIWGQLISGLAGDQDARSFIGRWAVRRPRDVLYFVKEVISVAVNRGHLVVSEEDLYTARRRYSEFAFRAILAEDDPQRGKLEAVLYEFAGCPRQLRRSDLEKYILSATVDPSDVEFYIDLLCDLNFLGIQRGAEFVFARDEGERMMLREVARRVASKETSDGEGEMYQIGGAFYDVLQIR